MNPFSFTTYKEFLREFIEQQKGRGTISKLAEICGCDRTYISQILNGKADMTPDQMIQFCEHFSLSDAESNYLLLLLLHDRSASLKSRRALQAKLKKAKSEALEVSRKVSSKEKFKEIDEELRTLYYSSWVYGAVHILTSIEEFQTALAISEKLNLPPGKISQVLKDLVQMRLVLSQEGRFSHSGGDIYLPRHHAQSTAHHLSWRMKAVERSFEKEDIHYSLAFSVSEKDVEKLRLQILDLIEDQRKLVRSSGTEVAYAFCIDFFEI